jgi:MFS family permease
LSFGLVVGAYGLAMMFGQLFLGQSSDRYGRKQVIIAGMLLNTALYLGIAFSRSFSTIVLVGMVAGLGAALVAPALSAFYLDITAEEYRSRILGMKSSALALGGVLGPLAVVVASRYMDAQMIFISALMLVLATIALTMIVLRNPDQLHTDADPEAWEIANKRGLAAQASLQGIVFHATDRRKMRGKV